MSGKSAEGKEDRGASKDPGEMKRSRPLLARIRSSNRTASRPPSRRTHVSCECQGCTPVPGCSWRRTREHLRRGPAWLRRRRKRILRFGLIDRAVTAFHIASHRKALTMSGFGGTRSASEPEVMTDSPLASKDDPMSQGVWVGAIPSASRKIVWVTVIRPRVNEKII